MTEPLSILTRYREQSDPPMTCAELAERLAVSVATISRWESGQRRVSRSCLPRVSRVTGIPASDLRPDLAKLFDGANQ